MCIYDGRDSELYREIKFKYFCRERFNLNATPMQVTLDQHFRRAAKRLRKSKEIDKLWGNAHLEENIFFSAPADHLYTAAKIPTGLCVQQEFEAEYSRLFHSHAGQLVKLYRKPHLAS